MKKIIQTVSVFLATIILFQSAICWLLIFFVWNQNMNFQKEEMEKNIPVEKLTVIRIHETSNAFRINENEIEVNGALFDIVSKANENGYEIFYCLPDEAENELINQLNETENREEEQGLVSFLKSLNIEYLSFQKSMLRYKNILDGLQNSEREIKLLSGYRTIIFSPPDFIA